MAHPTPDSLALVALGEDVEPGTTDHVLECRACFAEVEALRQVVTVGRSLGPEDRLTAPHPRVWARLAEEVHDASSTAAARGAQLHAVEPRDAERHAVEPSGGGRTRPRRWATVVLAAAAALVVGLAGGYALKGLVAPATQSIASTQLNALPAWSGANGTAQVEDGANGERTLVVSMELPATIDVDGTFEVWMSDSLAQDMLSMGVMTSGSTARFPIPASVDLASHPVVDVSLEPSGDTDPQHSDTSVVRGRLPV